MAIRDFLSHEIEDTGSGVTKTGTRLPGYGTPVVTGGGTSAVGITSNPTPTATPTTSAPTPTAPAPATGGGSGGGGGSTDLVAEPTPNTKAGGDKTGSTKLEDLTEEQIAQAMSAIEARFGLTREQLLADKSAAGLAYKRLLGELTRVRQQAAEGVEQDALRRGLFRSGIHAEQQADVQQQFAEQRAAAAAERQQRVDAINQALSELKSQQAAEQASTEAEIRREALLAEAS